MNDQHHRPRSGPFGMGGQSYLILAIIVLGSALFAGTRGDWISMAVSALVLPLLLIALIGVVSRIGRNRPLVTARRTRPRQDVNLLTFLARTNPFMFLVIGALSRGVDDAWYQELLRRGPYGMGRYGYLIVLAVVLGPLILAIIIMAFTGQLPAHRALHF